MAWWYEIRGDENRLVELRRGFASEQMARKAAARAVKTIKMVADPNETETLRIVTGADPQRTKAATNRGD
jgi:hypothetical protein